jgi:anti-sigma B factor antagonist
MDIEFRERGSITVVAPRQKLDTANAPAAGEEFAHLVERGVRKIVVDFSDVEYIASGGLRVLLATAKQLRAVGGELRVCALNETVREVFDISGFSSLLTVFPDEGEAIREF